jgi:transporter family-2 protein
MSKLIWFMIAFVSGAFLPIQAGLNGRLGRELHNPVYASMISFITGALAVCIYILLTRQSITWAGLRAAPAYVWLAGPMGAFYVTVIILAFPRIGPALTFGLVVAGQMVISILLDHLKILVMEPHPINIWRALGVLLIVTGVVIIQKF